MTAWRKRTCCSATAPLGRHNAHGVENTLPRHVMKRPGPPVGGHSTGRECSEGSWAFCTLYCSGFGHRLRFTARRARGCRGAQVGETVCCVDVYTRATWMRTASQSASSCTAAGVTPCARR
jgi:hypothetical protein